MTKKHSESLASQSQHQTDHSIGKNKKAKKSFSKMKLMAKKRGFVHRVDVSEKGTVCQYLNEELKRHIDLFLDK